ncbi:hypothetical protein GO491_04255 [Flavobacteriaceae bacterium Ap0902]|nr:hypothetical protein [Flavobacteriaceae bacterium Ap0902]
MYYSIMFCSMLLCANIYAQQPSCSNRIYSGQWENTVDAFYNGSNPSDVASAEAQIGSSTDDITVKMTSQNTYNTGIEYTKDDGKTKGNGYFNAKNSTENTGDISGSGYPFYTPDLTFKNALKFEAIFDYNKSNSFGTRTIIFTFSKPVKEIILNVDRLGGAAIHYNTGMAEANSGKFTLITPNVSITKLKGNSVFELDNKSFYRKTNVQVNKNFPGETVPNTPSLSTAAGSLLFTADAPMNSLTFTFTGKGNYYNYTDGTNDLPYFSDGVEFLFEICNLNLCDVSDNNLWFNDSEQNELSFIDVKNGEKTALCKTNYTYGDIAFAPNGKLYGVSYGDGDRGQLYEIDPLSCNEALVPNSVSSYGSSDNSLTFLPDGTALRGFGYRTFQTSKRVMRITSLSPYREEIWHDFSNEFSDGRPGGDFVIFRNKIYISWYTTANNPTETRLLEVTFNPDNYNFISVRDLGKIYSPSHGLTTINGELYSASENKIYKIDIPSTPVQEITQTLVHSDPNNVLYFGATSFQESLGDECIVCTAEPFNGGQDLNTKIGISTIKRNTEDWVTSHKNGFIKLESKKYGFVPTKLTTQERSKFSEPVEGMMIWNITTQCMELYNGSEWKCTSIGCNK